jgi:hypothetical protein
VKHETDSSCQLSPKINSKLEFHIRDKGRVLRPHFCMIYILKKGTVVLRRKVIFQGKDHSSSEKNLLAHQELRLLPRC